MSISAPEGADLALRVALDGLEAGRYVLVSADGTLELVGDGVGRLLSGDTDAATPPVHPGLRASVVLGDVGDPLPAGVARCVPEGVGISLEGTFAPVPEGGAEAVRAELMQLAATLGAPADRPALRGLLDGVVGRPAGSAPAHRAATLVLLRRVDAGVPATGPEAIPPEAAFVLAPVLTELAALRATVDELAGSRATAAEVTALRAVVDEFPGLQAVADELAQLRTTVEDLRAREAGVPARDHAALAERLEQARGVAEAAREEAAELRDELQAARDDLQRRDDELREVVRNAVVVAEQARTDARVARTEAESARADLALERDRLTDSAGRPAVRPERVAEIWRQMVGAAGGPPAAPVARVAADALLPRPPEPGFDDVAEPLAHVGLDGRFLRLNPAFSRLVGYAERDFAKATWPSLLDRAGYQAQVERRADLIEGRAERVALDSSYLGGSGLLVTVRGHVELVRGPTGDPQHLLLVGGDRQTL